MAPTQTIVFEVGVPGEGKELEKIPVEIPLDGDLPEEKLKEQLRASGPFNVRISPGEFHVFFYHLRTRCTECMHKLNFN